MRSTRWHQDGEGGVRAGQTEEGQRGFRPPESFRHRIQETVKRVHDGAIGDIVAIEENFLRGPYRVIPRDKKLTELQFQCSTQYHFTWLSGDDVPQSLVHNVDRSLWRCGTRRLLNVTDWPGGLQWSTKSTATSSTITRSSMSSPTTSSCTPSAVRPPDATRNTQASSSVRRAGTSLGLPD